MCCERGVRLSTLGIYQCKTRGLLRAGAVTRSICSVAHAHTRFTAVHLQPRLNRATAVPLWRRKDHRPLCTGRIYYYYYCFCVRPRSLIWNASTTEASPLRARGQEILDIRSYFHIQLSTQEATAHAFCSSEIGGLSFWTVGSASSDPIEDHYLYSIRCIGLIY